MEQLAHFVTKSFEYNNNNNNRVLEIINMSAKLDDRLDGKFSENTVDVEDDDDEESVDIDITDNSSENEMKSANENSNSSTQNVEICDKTRVKVPTAPQTNALTERISSPIPLIKKLNRDGSKHITKNWLISDVPKRKLEHNYTPFSQKSTPKSLAVQNLVISSEKHNDQENSAMNLIRVEDLISKKQSLAQFRPKPVTELLQKIREINNQSPMQNSNSSSDQFKTEYEDDKFKAGKQIFVGQILLREIY